MARWLGGTVSPAAIVATQPFAVSALPSRSLVLAGP
jgi:hypothetical protein